MALEVDAIMIGKSGYALSPLLIVCVEIDDIDSNRSTALLCERTKEPFDLRLQTIGDIRNRQVCSF